MTTVLDFVEDPVSRYIGGSGGMEDSVLSVLHMHRLRPRICLVRRVTSVTSGRSQEKRGRNVTE